MKNLKQYKLLSLMLILAYVLSACSGVPVGAGGQSPQDDRSQEVVFTGTVEAVSAGQWTVSGQVISITGATAVDTNIQVGDNVKVEAMVDKDGVVTAVSIETAGGNDNANDANANDDNSNDGNTNDDASNSNGGQADNSNNDNGNANDNTNDNDNSATGTEQEVFGTVEAITAESITIDGVVYEIASFTEFKDLIAVGDSVKVHVILNANGMLTIREIEKSDDAGDDDNSNSNGSDGDSNSNEDDDSHDNSDNTNDNHDDSGNDNGDDEDNENDSGSNSNG